jgi:hypothetical protein
MSNGGVIEIQGGARYVESLSINASANALIGQVIVFPEVDF